MRIPRISVAETSYKNNIVLTWLRRHYRRHPVSSLGDTELQDLRLALANRFGRIVHNKFFQAVAGYPDIAEVRMEKMQETNIGGGWHMDHSYDAESAIDRGDIGLKIFVRLMLFFWLTSSSVLAENIASARGATAQDYLLDDQMIEHAGAVIQVRTYGKSADVGEYVLIIPSLGRGTDDYTEKFGSTITTRLVENGFRVILIQPRGVGRSTGDLTPANASMSGFAQDIKAALDARGIEQVNLIGHAYGNRLARTFATLYPSYVDDLILLASGGNFEMNDRQQACLRNSFDLRLDDTTRLEAIQCAFFAEGNDPRVWLDGWYPRLAQAQVLAATMINTDFYKRAGGKPFMIIQATEDFIAPPDKAGKALKAELGEQVTYVEVKHAGHALSSERPEQVSNYIVEYFRRGTPDS